MVLSSKWRRSCTPYLLAAVFSTFDPTSVPCHFPPLPPLLHSLFSLLHTPNRAPSHWRPSSRTLPVRAPTARANFLSQSKIFESVQGATSSPWQIFEPVQDATSSPCQISSQSNATAANFRVSPRPLCTAPAKIDRRAINSYKQL
jgi:hypothetical protein